MAKIVSNKVTLAVGSRKGHHTGRFNRINAIGGSMKDDWSRRIESFKVGSSNSKNMELLNGLEKIHPMKLARAAVEEIK